MTSQPPEPANSPNVPLAKYHVDVHNGRGVQIGDHNHQTNHFGEQRAVPDPTSPAGAMVEQLTTSLRSPAPLRGLLDRINRNRFVVVSGPPGSGKSTMVASLTRPYKCDLEFTSASDPYYVHAISFLQATSTPDMLADEIRDQLRHSLPGYREHANAARSTYGDGWYELDPWDQQIIEPLKHLHATSTEEPCNTTPDTPTTVRIIIDGWDQPLPQRGYSEEIHTRVRNLATRKDLDVTIITTIDLTEPDDSRLTEAAVMAMPAPQESVLATYLSGGGLLPGDAQKLARICTNGTSAWLLTRLMAERFTGLPENEKIQSINRLQESDDHITMINDLYRDTLDTMITTLGGKPDTLEGRWTISPILAPLAVTGAGPTIPRTILEAIAHHDGLDHDHVDNTLDKLNNLLVRPHKHTDHETVGLFHPTLRTYLTTPNSPHWVDTDSTTTLLIDTLQELPTNKETINPTLAPWLETAEFDYLWNHGHHHRAIRTLTNKPLTNPHHNLERWSTALTHFTKTNGPTNYTTLQCRYYVAEATGSSGNPKEALALFQDLMPDSEEALGDNSGLTLGVRSSIAGWIGELGDPETASQMLIEILPNLQELIGNESPPALVDEANIAAWISDAGHPQEALARYVRVMPRIKRKFGEDSPTYIRFRSNMLVAAGRSGDPRTAAARLEQLAKYANRVLGKKHAVSISVGNNYGDWHGKSGDLDGAIEIFNNLLRIARAELGYHHQLTLSIRANLARAHADKREFETARAMYTELLEDTVNTKGSDYPQAKFIRGTIEQIDFEIARREL